MNDAVRPDPRHPDAGPGLWITDTEPNSVDTRRLRAGRLANLRSMMREKEYAAVLLFDPNNQRYATGSRNMFGYFLRNSTRYFFVPTEGPIILFEYPQSAHVSTCLETVQEARNSKIVWSSVAGRDADTASPFAAEIADLVRQYGRGSKKLGLDRCGHLQALALERAGCTVTDCQQEILHARRIKSDDEIACLRLSMAASESAVASVRDAVRARGVRAGTVRVDVRRGDPPGRRVHRDPPVDLGSAHQPLVQRIQRPAGAAGRAGGARHRRHRLLRLFLRFLPDFSLRPRAPDAAIRECCTSSRMTRFNTTSTSSSPASRTGKYPSAPGKSPRLSWSGATPRSCMASGCTARRRSSRTPRISPTYGGNGVLEPGMVVSVESYIGEVGGSEGVKLEEEVLITASGAELISRFPFEESLLSREF